MAHKSHTLSWCGQQVRQHDNDRFLTALFAPADKREALFALYAFNLEIARTREVVTQPMLGQIRLQWWRDRIEELYVNGTVPPHEVLKPLAEAVQRYNLDRACFDRLIDAREADLTDEPHASLICMVNYADVTSTPLIMLALEILGVRNSAASEAARHVGIAWALTGLLRAVPFHAHDQRHYLPQDLLDAHGVKTSLLFEGKPQGELTGVVKAVAQTAQEHLTQARVLRPIVPQEALPALLPAALSSLYLRVIQRNRYDPFAPRIQMANPFRQLWLAYSALTGRW